MLVEAPTAPVATSRVYRLLERASVVAGAMQKAFGKKPLLSDRAFGGTKRIVNYLINRGRSMPEYTLTAEYPDALRADSVIGRLEVLGIPPRNITKTSAAGPRVAVSAKVEDRLAEKARQILKGG